MLDQLTSVQLSEWESYNRLDPIGTWRDDIRIAALSSLIANIVKTLYPEKGVEPVLTNAMDFMVDWGTDENEKGKPEQSVEEQKRILLGIARSLRKRDEKTKTRKRKIK